jgi:hypothetical protein
MQYSITALHTRRAVSILNGLIQRTIFRMLALARSQHYNRIIALQILLRVHLSESHRQMKALVLCKRTYSVLLDDYQGVSQAVRACHQQ